jgi:hypothetical protein
MQRHDTFAILPNVATHEQIHRLAITIQEQWPAACSPASPARRGWSDLPEDILDMVYGRFCFSSYDRACFTAVCSSWRTVASWHPTLPALPLLHPLTGGCQGAGVQPRGRQGPTCSTARLPIRKKARQSSGRWLGGRRSGCSAPHRECLLGRQSAALCQTKQYWM